MRAAKLATVVRIKSIPAVTRVDRTGSAMCAACSRAGRLWLMSAIAL